MNKKLKGFARLLLAAFLASIAVPALAQSAGSAAGTSPTDRKVEALVACENFVGQFEQMAEGQAMLPDFVTGTCLPALAGKPYGVLKKACSDKDLDLLPGLVILLKPGAPGKCQVYYPKVLPPPPAASIAPPERMQDFSAVLPPSPSRNGSAGNGQARHRAPARMSCTRPMQNGGAEPPRPALLPPTAAWFDRQWCW